MPENNFTTATFLLSRTDSIGDVILTLPMAGFIKKAFPQSKVIFLARTYTKDIVALSEHVDVFLNYDELEKMPQTQAVKRLQELGIDIAVHVFPNKNVAQLVKAASIPLRVGTRNRFYHWFTCNKLIALSRKNSPYHEAQLNIMLLSFLGLQTLVAVPNIAELYGFTNLQPLEHQYQKLLVPNKKLVILHPKSKGSAREWGLENFKALIMALPSEKVQVYISGTADDANSMQPFLHEVKTFGHVTDITGKMNLQQFIAFIYACDALVAASTGPLHISAALGKKAIGLYSSRRPIHPGRWAPIGKQALALVFDTKCKTCAEGKDCDCITKISASEIANLLLQ